jgi:hypothetical protein
MIEPSKLVQALHHLPLSCGKFKPPTNEPDLFLKRGLQSTGFLALTA